MAERTLPAVYDRVLATCPDETAQVDQSGAVTFAGSHGHVEVPVNTADKGRFLTHVLNDSAAGLIVIEDGYADRLAELEIHGQAGPAPGDAGELMAYMYT